VSDRNRFPFGIQPEVSDPNRDERGPDTVNRLLLHGARYHDRAAVFVTASNGAETPDWRADRLSIRLGLALHEELAIGAGDVVALLMPLSLECALVERGLWGLGAVSLPLSPDAGSGDLALTLAEARPRAVIAERAADVVPLRLPDSVIAVVTIEDETGATSLRALLDRGGVLDTPEKASRFRATARLVPPEAPASLEREGKIDHGGWARRIERFLLRFPPKRGGRHVLRFPTPDLGARIVLHAGWADGLTTVVLEPAGDGPGGTGTRVFATLSDVEGFEGGLRG
jgi:hypothetical protein